MMVLLSVKDSCNILIYDAIQEYVAYPEKDTRLAGELNKLRRPEPDKS